MSTTDQAEEYQGYDPELHLHVQWLGDGWYYLHTTSGMTDGPYAVSEGAFQAFHDDIGWIRMDLAPS